MNQIKFSHNYLKLHNQETAVLLDIKVVSVNDLNKDLIEYDTKIDDSTYYNLPKDCDVMILCFFGNKFIPFTTIRRYTGDKYKYYFNEICKEFKIVISGR